MSVLPSHPWIFLLAFLLLTASLGDRLASRQFPHNPAFQTVRSLPPSWPIPPAPAPGLPKRKAILLLEEESPTSESFSSRTHAALVSSVHPGTGPVRESLVPAADRVTPHAPLCITLRTLLI